MNKYDIKRLRAARRTANRRLQELDKLGLSNIPTINTVRGALKGGKYIPQIPKYLSEDEYNDYRILVDTILKDTRTTKKGAREFYEGKKKMFSDMLKGVLGHEIDPSMAESLMQYIPYEDMRHFLEDYIYEHIIDVALTLKNTGLSYSFEYMEMGMKSNITGVVAQTLVDSGAFTDEEMAKGVVGDYVHYIIDFNHTVQEAIADWLEKKQQYEEE